MIQTPWLLPKPNAAPAIVHTWRKFLALGCSHGYLSDPVALKAILDFKSAYKPDTVLHLGDAIDTTAFRSGAKGSADESSPVEPDLEAGLNFIRELAPHYYLCGNHEDRLWNLQFSPNALVSELAIRVIADIETTCDSLHCQLIPWHYKQHIKLGNYSFMHGTIFSENCARDMAEVWGNCIFAHAHRAGMAKGRRVDNPTGICVGHLMQPTLAHYAKARKSTYAWSQGFAWGEYSDTRTVAWLHEQPQNQAEWILPL